jgi:hypothetical protein
MTVREIVKKWLEDNKYDGLCTEGCGCECSDLFPCGGQDFVDCESGHKTKSDDSDYDFLIIPG